MTAKVFFDTNVLVYAALGADDHEAKRRRALALIDAEDFGTSAQVLQEFYVTVTRKAALPLSPAAALEWIEHLTTFPCLPVDHQLVRIAIELAARYRLSYWDACILAAAETLGARTLYSEDLSHGQLYGQVRVLNPFA
jgi:predicted nucleic acid-binding protein